jgi:hypothetical protein
MSFGIVSGHTLKHFAATAALAVLLVMGTRRELVGLELGADGLLH